MYARAVPLIKRRPEIMLFAPRAIRAGDEFVASLRLSCAEAVPVSAVDVELRGAFTGQLRTQGDGGIHEQVFLRQRARVAEEGELSAGEHTYKVSFRLSDGLPASYEGDDLRIEYVIAVHVDIPWWPDARASFVLKMVAVEVSAPVASPRVYASAAGGAPGSKPYLEVSLGVTDVEPGGTLRGAVALSNTTTNDYRAIEIALVGVESIELRSGRHTHHRKARSWRLPVQVVAEGEPQRFKLSLPETLVPAFKLGVVSLRWFLDVRAKVAWSRDPEVWIPLTVRASGVIEEGDVRAPLAVGSERVSLVWRSVAEARGLVFADGVLRWRGGDVELAVSREHRGREGGVLRGALAFPELGIGLSAENGALTSRDPDQARWLSAQLGPPLTVLLPAQADDRGLVFELRDSGQDRSTLLIFVDGLLALAKALDPLLTEVPPPSSMVELVPAWARAAQALGLRLRPGPMVLRGRVDGCAIEVRTGWDIHGLPDQTIFELTPGRPIDGRYHLSWFQGEALPESKLPLAELVSGERARALDISADSVRIDLRGALEDPEAERTRITALVEVGRRLEGRRGGYR